MSRKNRSRRILVIALAAMVGACGTSGSSSPPTAPSPPAPSLGAVDPSLVGNWSGTVDGSFGPGTFSMTLSQSGAMSASGSGNYCSSNGDWAVSAGQFRVTARDCSGTILTLTAPASNTRLSGSWSASSGRAGTFDCTKEP